MPRNPLYQARVLTLDYNEESNQYILKRDNNNGGSRYHTQRQVESLIESLEKSIKTDPIFRKTSLIITRQAKSQLDEKLTKEI